MITTKRSIFLTCLTTALWASAGSSACHSQCHESGDCGQDGGDDGVGGSGGAAMRSLAERYCDCMMVSCHDSYHAAFGPSSDEDAARANCLAEAEALPVAGEDVDQGNFVECRLHHCELGKTDENACPSAIGEEACTDGAGGGTT